MELLDPPLWERAADALARARRIHFYGVGASGFVALDAQHKFARIGMDAWAYTDPHLASAFAALLEQGDVAVGISHSGGTLDTLHALRAAREAGATTMCITHRMDAPIVELASIALFTSGHEAPFRSGAIVSRMAQLAVVDALFIAVAIRRGADAMRRLLASREAVEEKHVGPGKAWRDT
ncbi:MAG: MurR/RpiR family transcriptional regulator [Limnochordaceae bacterium]|nr:MurR/RpiR family transcriptional regulator [Limnochordaceae bacterium]